MQERRSLKSPASLTVAAEVMLGDRLKTSVHLTLDKELELISIFLLFFQVFELSPSLYVVELRKSYGDISLYRQVRNFSLDHLQVLVPCLKCLISSNCYGFSNHISLMTQYCGMQLCTKLSNDLGVCQSQQLLTTEA